MKKAQTAMEFLMTYGWAILIILAVIAVLFSLDVFNPKVPNNCISVSPITCYDIRLVESGFMQITLSSSDTDTATLTSIALTNPSTVPGSCTPSPNTITVDAKSTLNCYLSTDALTSGTRFEGNANINYRLSGGSIDHGIVVKFSGTIEGED